MIRRKTVTRASPRRRRLPRTQSRAPPRTLLPVMAPTQNMREIIKQCIMLEDHLVHPSKRCADCTSKHMLAIEGLAEECGTLCNPKDAANKLTATEATKIAQNTRVLHHTWAADPKNPAVCRAVASHLRAMRKQLMTKYATLPLAKLPTEEQRVVTRLVKRARLTRKGGA